MFGKDRFIHSATIRYTDFVEFTCTPQKEE